MRRRFLASAILTGLLLTPAALARGPVYSYTDESGVVHFTNRPADPRYAKLAQVAASNLGQPSETLDVALRWLRANAMETDEAGVVAEVNHCRDLI